MSTETDAMSTTEDRDPRVDPQNGDILHRPDITGLQSVRVCHGSNPVEVGDNQISWVRFELPLRRNELKTVRIETWRSWAADAEVLTEEQLQDMVASADAG